MANEKFSRPRREILSLGRVLPPFLSTTDGEKKQKEGKRRGGDEKKELMDGEAKRKKNVESTTDFTIPSMLSFVHVEFSLTLHLGSFLVSYSFKKKLSP
jgi:hypothetical protein